MKTRDIPLISLIIVAISVWSLLCYSTYNAPIKIKQQAVDLPEEYMNLSHNSAKPDTVLAFYDNDTVYIQFK